MVIVSAEGNFELFQILNSKKSGFHFVAIFFNLSRFPLYPKEIVSINFLIFMKYYLMKIEQTAESRL